MVRTVTLRRAILGVLFVASLNLGIGFFFGYQQGKQALWDWMEYDYVDVVIPPGEGKPHHPMHGWGIEREEGTIYLWDVGGIDELREDGLGYYYTVTFILSDPKWAWEEIGEIKKWRTVRWHQNKEEVIDLWGKKFQILEILNSQSFHPEDGIGNHFFVLLREIR